ncbi:hypothetical protein TNCV_4773161 [Trichonephila clavipes]|nr:hypothetical protein TNCV_4773161 [Trichonephila clavipes]
MPSIGGYHPYGLASILTGLESTLDKKGPIQNCTHESSAIVSSRGKRSFSLSKGRTVPLKIRRVGQRCTLNLSRAETSSRWCGVVVRRGGASSGVVHVT